VALTDFHGVQAGHGIGVETCVRCRNVSEAPAAERGLARPSRRVGDELARGADL